jgi:Amt family ammonium transporter
MGAIVLGLMAGAICLWGVNGLKKLLGADDAFDVFGVHGVGGILGAVLTGVLASPDFGGLGNTLLDDPHSMSITSQLAIQIKSVGVTLVWSGVVAFAAYKIASLTVGLRVPEEEEREGLDITAHGESAYHY